MATNCRLAMVILMVNDIEKAVTFYETLGAAQRCLFPKSWAELTLEGITIALCHTEQEGGQRRTGLVFAVDDLMAFYGQHKGTLNFLEEPVTKLHGIMTSLQDASGNIVELYQATPEKVREFMEKQKESGCCGSKAACSDEDSCKDADTRDTCCKS
jgi:catechol 2,3-dioxygenase-like lactoylglutathione lyase family enzyme